MHNWGNYTEEQGTDSEKSQDAYSPAQRSVIHGNRKAEATQAVFVDGGVDNQLWEMRIMEYYPALERKALLTRATTQMNSDDIMLKRNKPSHRNMA